MDTPAPEDAFSSPERLLALSRQIKEWGQEPGFAQVGIAGVELGDAEAKLLRWLERGFHGEMDYMARHGTLRSRPAELVSGTLRVIAARMDYVGEDAGDWVEKGWESLQTPARATVTRYAQGRDYHRVLRARLKALAERIASAIGPYGFRVFTDSAPLMEVELARQAGLGWRGKHTLLLSREGGSMFFLGEILIDLPLPVDAPVSPHCGSCQRCIDVCPTRAIVAPYLLDARRCISYLTIELKGSIPIEFRPLIGNRVYGCDDCQLVCPWNKYAKRAVVADFDGRGLDHLTLMEAFSWSEAMFLERTQGSAMRRIGYLQWLRNVAVGMGNALATMQNETSRTELRATLATRADHPSELVREHVRWALAQAPGVDDSSAPTAATAAT